MKAIYFCDPAGDEKEGLQGIKDQLFLLDLKKFPIRLTTLPPWHDDYDVLFFDWGGMSLGNSMLDHFCEHFIQEAVDKPGRAFIMTSSATKRAMEDAMQTFSREPEGRPTNVFLSIEEAAKWLKSLQKSK